MPRRPSLNKSKEVRHARRLLNESYDTPISIKELSREVALSPFHLIRSFRRAYKQTPHQYVVDQRINKAKELLRNSNLSVTDICFEVGYESLGSFSTLFRKLTGLSPQAYRLSSQPETNPGYIPLCACLMYGIEDEE